MGINPWDYKPMRARRRSLRWGKWAWGQVDTGNQSTAKAWGQAAPSSHAHLNLCFSHPLRCARQKVRPDPVFGPERTVCD